MSFSIDNFVLTTGEGDELLKATMNRYVPKSYHRQSSDAGFILLFGHGTGFHKEHFEPTIEHLFELDQDNNDTTKILEAWAIDCQNHGNSAPLNDDLFLRKPKLLNIRHYAEAFAKLYRSGLLGDIQKGVQKVVLVGHSAGAVANIFTTALFGTASGAPFDMVILVEPPLFGPDNVNNMTEVYKTVVKTTPSRRSIWESKEEAHKWLTNRLPWKVWDPRVLKLYVEHGLRPLPTPFCEEKRGMVLVSNPVHETAAYAQVADTLDAFAHLSVISGTIPFHAIFGARNDMFSRTVQDAIHNPSASRIIVSVTRIEGTGHLIVQEKPKELAKAISDILQTGKTREWNTGSKL